MTKNKTIECWEVEIKFVVRKGSHEAENKKKLLETIREGIGGNDMECIEAEDIEVKIR